MEILILKSAACLAILMVFYKLFLEHLSIHKFKRFYLLGALVVSIVIPFITFIEYIEPVYNFGNWDPNNFGTTPPYFPSDVIIDQPKTTNYLPIILWSIYGLGVLLFTSKFCINLFGIVSKINKNEKKKHNNFISVLLNDLIVPHTFFSYIFLNKTKFEAKAIPQEVLLHEQTHASQKHSLDILFIELLQIIFWFNPLLYFIKKDIKLNHEFLADDAVLKQGIDSSTYQETLLQFTSIANEIPLAHAINYSLIKKRFTIMKTKTSKKAIWLRSLLLLPLLGGLLFSFSGREQVEKEVVPAMVIPDEAQKTDVFTTIKEELTEINSIKKFNSNSGNLQDGATPKQLAEYNRLAKKYNSKNGMKIIKKREISKIKEIYSLMSIKQKENAEPFPDLSLLPPPPAPPKVKKGENSNIPPPPPPPPAPPEGREDERQLTFVNLNGSTHVKVTVLGNSKYYNSKGFLTDKNGNVLSKKQVDGSKVIPGQKITKMYRKGKVVAKFKKTWEDDDIEIAFPESSAPPEPISTAALIENMTINNATFYFNGDKISSDRAKELVKTNKELNISSHTNNGISSVHLSTDPISIVNGKAVSVKHKNDPKGINEAIKNSETIESIKLIKGDSKGYVLIKNKTCYYVKEKDTIKYFNRWGVLIDENGEELTNSERKNKDSFVKDKERIYNNRKAEMENRKQMLEEKRLERKAAINDRKEEMQNRRLENRKPLTERFKGMEANGTQFFYEGDKISEAKAIELVKENPKLNVSMQRNNDESTVHLSKKGIKIVNGRLVTE